MINREHSKKEKWARGMGVGVSAVETKRAQNIFPSFFKAGAMLADERHFVNGGVWDLDRVGEVEGEARIACGVSGVLGDGAGLEGLPVADFRLPIERKMPGRSARRTPRLPARSPRFP